MNSGSVGGNKSDKRYMYEIDESNYSDTPFGVWHKDENGTTLYYGITWGDCKDWIDQQVERVEDIRDE